MPENQISSLSAPTNTLVKDNYTTPADFQKGFLQKLMLSATKAEYKPLLTQEENIMKNLHAFVVEQLEGKAGDEPATIDLDMLKSYIIETEMVKYEQTELLVVTLWTLFLKENQVGQSVYT